MRRDTTTLGTTHSKDHTHVRIAARFARTLAFAAIAGAPLGGCGALHVFAPTEVQRGVIVEPDALKELIPGTSSRADAIAVLGSPTAKATFDDNKWIYIGQITSTRIGRTPGIEQQQVVVLTFDQGGTLRDVHKLTKDDGKQLAMNPGMTPSPGSEANFMQQLLGNVGKFSPAGLPGAGASGPSSGVGFGSNTGNSLR